ncbi:hypothetical protein EJ08DRAFT_652876 [Tothia fuscella]|uniref:CENP-C homolog n=1 Tax=Tothia fuscella TaxID=1048955 RepID=A0A9P4TUA9_9PEZI|nr:hypothetical protein EJ08DRAFT_652876 [Tothia fuscella]
MAPPATNGRKKRDNQYFEVGVQGRKTGLTLPENPRDEHGIEDLNGLFSSPEKSPTKRVIRNGNTTLTSDEMELAQSSVPEPTEVLSTHRLKRSTKTVLPPPIGRSPFKTNIGSSPRRQSSIAPMSQARRNPGTPERAASHPAVSRRLDFSETTILQSPLRTGARRQVSRRDVYDLEETEEEIVADEVDMVDNNWDDPSLQLLGDEAVQNGTTTVDEDLDVDIEPTQVSSPTAVKKSKRKTRSSGGTTSKDTEPEEESEVIDEPQPGRAATQFPNQRAKKGKGKLFVSKPSQPLEDSAVSEEPVDESTIEPPPTKKQTRGRPKKNVDESVLADDASEVSVPKKRGRPAGTAKAQAKEAPPAKKAKTAPKATAKAKAKEPLSERTPNAKMAPPSFKPPARPAAGSPSKRSSPSMWAGARAVSRLREGTPAVDVGVTTTRSGRTVLKPLQHWAGERAVFTRDGTIKDVILSESVELPKVHRNGHAGKSKKRRGRAHDMDTIEEEEEDSQDDPEEWEVRHDRIVATVKRWDPTLGQGLEDDEEEHEIAFGANSFILKATSNAEFHFAKLQSLPFFGTGVVELLPQGFKRSKNSRRMNMVFFVHEGKVAVTVGDTEFGISKGGIWHVPRGNFYNIYNHGTKTARLFYAQGCEVEVEQEDVEE